MTPLINQKPKAVSSTGQNKLSLLLQQIEERENAATPGPWVPDWSRVRDDQCETICLCPTDTDWLRDEQWQADRAFVASSRTDLPLLVKFGQQAVQFLESALANDPGLLATRKAALLSILSNRDAEKRDLGKP